MIAYYSKLWTYHITKNMEVEEGGTLEIEKKYRIKSLPVDLEQYACLQIEQGYLCKGPVVRIRKSNENYILTYKAKTHLSEQEIGAKMSHEVELPLSEQAYYHLREKIDGRLVEKERYLIPLDNTLSAELDIFHGYLEGLKIVEVEFASPEAVEAFEPPDWFGEDVTLDRRYTNSYLSTITSWEEVKEVTI